MKKYTKYTDEKDIYWKIEPHLLFDYLNFGNKLRLWQVTESLHKNYSMAQDGKRLCLVLLTEAYQKSLEDLSAVLLGLFRRYNFDTKCYYQKKFSVKETPLSYTLINYSTRDAYISEILKNFSSVPQFYSILKISDIESINFHLYNPSLNYLKYYKDLYNQLTDWSKDQDKRIKMYNKIKHGGIVVGSAKIFNSNNEDSPAAVFVDYEEDFFDHPLIVNTMNFKEVEFVLLEKGIAKIKKCINDLISIYLCKNYSNFLKKNGYKSPLFIFDKV